MKKNPVKVSNVTVSFPIFAYNYDFISKYIVKV